MHNCTNYQAINIITRVSLDFYPPQEITREMEQLFNMVETKKRMIRRQEYNKTPKDVRDMIEIFQELKTTSTVSFLAKYLSKPTLI